MINYVYTSAHMQALKKYSVMKILFILLGSLVLLLQSIAWIVVWIRDMDVSVSDMVFVGITLVVSFLFIASQMVYAFRNKKIIKAVEKDGQFVTERTKIKFSNKFSVGGAIVVFCKLMAVLFVILLGILMVSFIQNYLNWGKIILKMPLMVFLAVSFLQTSAELKYQSMLEKC